MKKIRHAIKKVVLTLFVLWILLFVYSLFNFLTAEERVTALCAQIKPGMPLAELATFADKNGLGPLRLREGTNYLVESKTYGRFGCVVVVKSGVVQQSKYNHAD